MRPSWGVRVNQRICFLMNVFRFPLPTRLQWVEPAGRGGGGGQKVEDVGPKTYMLIYPDPYLRLRLSTIWMLSRFSKHAKTYFWTLDSLIRHCFRYWPIFLWPLYLYVGLLMQAGNTFWRGRISTVGPLVLTSSDQLLFLQKQYLSFRRSNQP